MQDLGKLRFVVAATLLGSVSCVAHALTTDQAVKTLLGNSLPSQAAAWPLAQQGTSRVSSTTQANDGGRMTMLVPPGATLSRLLAPVLGKIQLPKSDVYKAFVSLNPQAFVGGNPNRLIAGAKLRLFSEADIAKLNGVLVPATLEQRRGWVRFP